VNRRAHAAQRLCEKIILFPTPHIDSNGRLD
jgi:hypothetical protein